MFTSSISKWSLLLAALMISLSGCSKDEIVPYSGLPDEIQTYVSTHFAGIQVLQSVIDRDGLTKTYDVVLEGNINLEFNRKKEIIGIDGSTPLPDSVIPEKILNYVQQNYPANSITGWEIDGKNQQVELDNGLDLEFNMKGDFLRIDS